jgi:hypothetical protein
MDQSREAFEKLFKLIGPLSGEQTCAPGVNGEWSVKDVLAHLHAWHGLMETWYTEGMEGRKPAIPAPGFTWKTTPELNEKIFREHRDEALDAVVAGLRESHSLMHSMIEKHTDEELFEKKKYPWTGSTSLAPISPRLPAVTICGPTTLSGNGSRPCPASRPGSSDGPPQ